MIPKRFLTLAVALFLGAAVCTAQVWQFPLYDDADDLTAFLIDGWTTKAASEPFVWIRDDATIGLSVRRAGAFAAVLESRADVRQTHLRVSVDGRLIAPPEVIGTSFGVTTLPIGTLAPGEHRLRLETLDGSDSGRPPGQGRPRVAVSRLTITRVGG